MFGISSFYLLTISQVCMEQWEFYRAYVIPKVVWQNWLSRAKQASLFTQNKTLKQNETVTILSNINMYCFSYSFVLLEREAFWFVDCEHPQPPSGFSCCGCVCIAGSRWIVRSPSVTQTNPEKAGCGKLKYPRNHGCCFLIPVNTSFLEQFAKVQ